MKKARLFRRSRSPNLYADFVTEQGERRQRSTRVRTPAEAWHVVAGWSDVPDEATRDATGVVGTQVHTLPIDVTPQGDDELDPLVAYHRVHGGPPTPEEQRFHDGHGRWPLSPEELEQWLTHSTSWWQRLGRRDWTLTAVLVVFSVGSAYTTIQGASQVLPATLAWPMGLAVQLLLFLLLEGLVARAVPIRRWGGVVVLTSLSIYTSFFSYYDQLAGDALDRRQVDHARQLHAALVASVYAPARSRALRLRSEGEALLAQAEHEARRGSTTGVRGYGPRARSLAEKGTRSLIDAERVQADVDRLGPSFEGSLDALTAEQVYRRDLEAWQLAPPDWKEGLPVPAREDYVSAADEVALLTPLHQVAAGEPAARDVAAARRVGRRDHPVPGDRGGAFVVARGDAGRDEPTDRDRRGAREGRVADAGRGVPQGSSDPGERRGTAHASGSTGPIVATGQAHFALVSRWPGQ